MYYNLSEEKGTPIEITLLQCLSTSGWRPHLGSPSDFRGVARLSTNFLKNDIRTEKCWPNSPPYSTDVGVLRNKRLGSRSDYSPTFWIAKQKRLRNTALLHYTVLFLFLFRTLVRTKWDIFGAPYISKTLS